MEERRALGNVIDRFTFVISFIVLLSLFIWMMAKGSYPQTYGSEEEHEADSPDDDH